MKPDIFISAFKLVLYLSAFLYGVIVLLKEKSQLYFNLLFFGICCFLLESIYYTSDYLCYGGWASDFSFAIFGAGGCFAFMLSAYFELSDNIKISRKTSDPSKKIAFIAPLILLIIYGYGSYYWINNNGAYVIVILTFLGKIAGLPASYFYFRNLISNDESSEAIKVLKLCSVFALLVIFSDSVSDFLYTIGAMYEASLVGILLPIALIGVLITANKVVQKWTV